MTKHDATQQFSATFILKSLLGKYVRPHAKKMSVALFFMVIAAAMTAGVAQLMQPILDDVLGAGNRDKIWPIGLAVFGTFFFRGISTYAYVNIMNRVGQHIVGDLQKDLFSHFMTLDLGFYHANPSGQLISRVMSDVNVVRLALSDSLMGMGKNLLTLMFLVAVMVNQDWKLSLLALVIAPFMGGFISYLGKRMRKISRRTQVEMANLSDRLSQTFQGIRQVQAYGMEDAENIRASHAIQNVRDLNYKAVRIGNLSTPVNDTLIGAAACGIIVYGGYQVAAGVMSTGQLISFLAAFTMAYEPLKKLSKLFNTIQMGIGAAERVFDMLQTKPSIRDASDAKILQGGTPDITFENVVFHYKDPEENALDGISFHVPAGKVTALVGPSGGGKTTIINMIPRFYDAVSGDIKINGQNLRDIQIASLRSNIALVSQDITMFDDSIATNIAYGRPGATQEEIEHAARLAAADAFIRDFPEGYNTRVGEDGVKLSGGQRQRIAIARALLRNAPILLLDEATSALDNESEKLVQAALKELEKGRTTIVIAHRLSTVKQADQIIVLDKGKIAEQGTHKELSAIDGLYARMVQAGLRE